VPELNFTEAELERLAELLAPLVAARLAAPAPTPVAYTPRTLAAELGRSERSIRAAIARGELAAVKRGRGYVISASAVEAWTRAERPTAPRATPSRPRRRSAPGPMRRALRETER
jgi:excisionase family DNA binding protein